MIYIKDKKLYFAVSAILAIMLTITLIRTDLPSFKKDHISEIQPDTAVSYANYTADIITTAHETVPYSVAEASDEIQPVHVTVPVYVTVSDPAMTAEPSERAGKININTADAGELTTLKGIGEKKAQKIIEYRSTYGGFKSIEEITEVKGIGEKTFESIKDHLCI